MILRFQNFINSLRNTKDFRRILKDKGIVWIGWETHNVVQIMYQFTSLLASRDMEAPFMHMLKLKNSGNAAQSLNTRVGYLFKQK